ncbi:MAG: hypothetical protein Q9171_003207 [Xanthocarpia ochracea]
MILSLSRGARLQRIPLSILFSRVQLDLIDLIAKHGTEGIPHTEGESIPSYTFDYITPMGRRCNFYVNAIQEQSLTYGAVNETVAGLRTYMLRQGHLQEVVFRVEILRTVRAFGGLSVREVPRATETWGNGSSIAEYVYHQLHLHPVVLAKLTNSSSQNKPLTILKANDVNLRCTYGNDLSPDAIRQAFDAARDTLRVKIFKEGISGLLPGPNGEWESEGDLAAAKLVVLGIAPAHLTWGTMQDAVQALSDLMDNGTTGKTADCKLLVGDDVVGAIIVK